MYPEELVTPMRQELTRIGFRELRTPGEVNAVMDGAQGTLLLVVNTFCPHAVRARPAVALALRNHSQPDVLATVFAGQDLEATARARSYLSGHQPSSPAFALFQQGRLVFLQERDQILGRPVEDIAADLAQALDRFC